MTSFQKLSRQVCDGGMGLDRLELSMAALHNRSAWRFISSDSLWASILRLKYGAPSIVATMNVKSSASNVWKIIHPCYLHCQIIALTFKLLIHKRSSLPRTILRMGRLPWNLGNILLGCRITIFLTCAIFGTGIYQLNLVFCLEIFQLRSAHWR